MMVHPSTHTRVEDSSLASTRLVVKYTGKSAHAAASPWSGANALEATIQTFNMINAWRCQLRESSRINGIIVNGGSAVNIIPEYSEANFGIRAASGDYREELVDRVGKCATAAAEGMGVSVGIERIGKGYDAVMNNPVLKGLMANNFSLAGEEVMAMHKGAGLGSTDMGNVTQSLPGVHCYIKVEQGIEPHTIAFAEACVGSSAGKAIAAGAKAMGMTTIDLFSNPGLVGEARIAFERKET
jgi:metal-dependent amidase/aminoacylase/carboxypeptidase family protein